MNWAWPLNSAIVASTLVPSLNVTLPVGVPPPGEFAVTVAVKVTELLGDEFKAEVNVVVDKSLVMVWDTVPELVLKLVSPL